ncbi:MAG TPA: LytTR family DNA-binding domain-containing protein, partial [Ignavibacteria bacterium]
CQVTIIDLIILTKFAFMNCIICANINSSRLLEEFVGKSSSLNLIGTFSDSGSIRALLSKRQDIDLIFLDVDMPEMDILNFINNFGHQANMIIVSQDDKDALKAFEFNIVDYLIKPVSFSRFCKAVDKAIRYFVNREVSNSDANEIFIKKGSTLVKLKIKEIIYVEALENYVTINTKNEKFTIHFTMKAIEYQLPSDMFIRVHRSFIVNISLIKTIKENSLDLIIANDLREVPIGNSYRDPLLNRINIMAR